MEGVWTPEIWIAVAEKTGIPALRRTTRDEPDYDTLMRFRLDLLEKKRLGLPDIQAVIGGIAPAWWMAGLLDRVAFAGAPPFRLDESWREGFIILPARHRAEARC